MNNNQKKELCLALMRADSEAEIRPSSPHSSDERLMTRLIDDNWQRGNSFAVATPDT